MMTGCGGGNHGGNEGGNEGVNSAPPTVAAALTPTAALGEKLFSDVSLSASGAQACATCHNPSNAHAQINDLAVQLGGLNLDQQGFRAPPSLNYLDQTPAFAEDALGHAFGGFDRDGRAPTMSAQAAGPLLSPIEMANADQAAVVNKVMHASYANAFQAVFGSSIFNNPAQAFQSITLALQQYQLESAAFHPYNSKYDQYLNGTVALTLNELSGLALFNDPNKGNCLQCHPSAVGTDGSAPLFTDFKYANLGVPRNPAIPNNMVDTYFDLGLCGPVRLDLASQTNLCGQFKTPTLRNVATRKVFFHNGRFNDLTEAVTFLVQRDTNPALWYPVVNGSVQQYNDMPPTLSANVDTVDAPFNRNAALGPALSDTEIADVVAFLNTLTDNYVAPN